MLDDLDAALVDTSIDEILYDWALTYARPNQVEPEGDWWATWLILAGRGFGKTRTGAEFIRNNVETGRMGRVCLLGRTAADVREVMIEGESGILACSPPWFRPKYEPSKRRLTWPNGAIATSYSDEQPDALRGPQHDGAWADEIASFNSVDSWDNLQFGLRLGRNPRCVVTTTPRPTPEIKALLADATTVMTTGSTYDNQKNLAEKFMRRMRMKYEGTRLGEQELHARVLDDTPGALWTQALIDKHRVRHAPKMQRVVIGVDPAVSSNDDSDETAITIAGLGVPNEKHEAHGYIIESNGGIWKPAEWGGNVVLAYRTHNAERVIAEINNGGALVEANLRAVEGGRNVSYKGVHASRGKLARAEPVASLYEQGRVHHVGMFAQLESQMTTYVPGVSKKSPDRLDATVWALTELMLDEKGEREYGYESVTPKRGAAGLQRGRGIM